ncbi:MAG: citrate (Si)-synthase [Phycisphaerales bacterium]|nr:MAG: citrate (Si)-synthase [Phycisphaerales bacterium]
MATLKETLQQKIPAMRQEIKQLIDTHGEKVISQVTVAQAYGGMRGVKCMVCDTSDVDPDKGLVIRGRPISELADRLPEEMFFLLLTGELPDTAALAALQDDLRARAQVPEYVWRVLRDLPADAHPMEMLDTGIMALERESEFRKRYTAGLRKEEHWEPALEDSLRLLAKLPALAAAVYRIRFRKGELIPSDPKLDWAGNYARMLGLPDPKGDFAGLIRLYSTLHCDHEGGNVSAFTCHVVASSLADPFYAVGAGIDGLAGPLHGLANQECLGFLLDVHKEFNGVPTAEQLKNYCWKLLESGRVVPGYGHAVLRCTDPRFVALQRFGQRVGKDDPIIRIMNLGFEVIPEVLKEQGKAKNPYPNVDAASGALLYHFGLKEMTYYTVVFGVSRALGLLAQLILNRAISVPITRPKSVTTEWIKAQVGA